MESLPINMNWHAFANYAAKQYEWFSKTIDDMYPEMRKDGEPMNFRRIDHLLSDKEIDGDNVKLKIQDGDYFINGLDTFISTLNGLIRKKYDCFFTIEKVDHF